MTAAKVCGLNHLTLAAGDLARTLAFYRDVLGFAVRAEWPEGAYLEAGAMWLCLSYDPAARTQPHHDYTHIALTAAPEDFAPLCDRIKACAKLWKSNTSEGPSLYFLDPDGHRLELHVGTLESRLAHYRAHPQPGRTLYPAPEK